MKVKKVFSKEMERCYSVACMDIDGVAHAFFATEGRNGGCIAVNCTDYEEVKEILSGPGGTMGMVKIPDTENDFISGLKFFSLADWEEAEVAWIHKREKGYEIKELFASPYLHRFDILSRNGMKWFIGCILAKHKKTKEDFSQAGYVCAGVLPDTPGKTMKVKVICDGLFRNHGYERVQWKGLEAGMVSCDSGVYVLTPPETPGEEWVVEKIMSQRTSDIAMADIDGDGEKEIACIEPFHGEYFRIYKKIQGEYVQVFEYPEISEFYHVVASCDLDGKSYFIGGCRRGKQQLFLVGWDDEKKGFSVQVVDEHVGPSNAMMVHIKEKNLLISANRETAEAAIYEIET